MTQLIKTRLIEKVGIIFHQLKSKLEQLKVHLCNLLLNLIRLVIRNLKVKEFLMTRRTKHLIKITNQDKASVV